MPIYDYQCRGCGQQFELLVLKTTVAACPACESQDLEQLISSFMVSSEHTRKSSLDAAKRKFYAGEYKEKKVADAEEIHHLHDH